MSGHTGTDFGLDQYERLAKVMGKIKGKALLTLNDHPEIRKLFAAFKYERAAVNYTVGGAKRTKPARALIYRSWR